jgi:hypothetical protein
VAVTLTCPSIPEYYTQNDLDRGIAAVDAVKAALPDSQAGLLQQLTPLVVLFQTLSQMQLPITVTL